MRIELAEDNLQSVALELMLHRLRRRISPAFEKIFEAHPNELPRISEEFPHHVHIIKLWRGWNFGDLTFFLQFDCLTVRDAQDPKGIDSKLVRLSEDSTSHPPPLSERL